MEISYWSDIACPFCYIGAARMKRAMIAVGMDPFDLKMKAYQLNPQAPIETDQTMATQFAASHGMTDEEAQQQFAHMSAMGAEEGLHLDVASAIPTNTMSAHRLVKWAENRLDKVAHQEFIMKLYKLYFEDYVSIADKAVLLQAAVEMNLPESEVATLLDSQEFEDEVKQDMLEAQQSGVQGAPFFVINNKYGISGAQPYDYMVAVLKQIQEEG
ncbi:DsbA family oxidoreductase [Streptococcus halotolerans]|uniref:DsbA family oxidoreductase n=1 Tax=Streptococcus halotolerans TaxID=1814128 RepID=UPI000786C983|nr:DsbA family oxidoreductase [Streptococcus halotolerans]